MKHAQEDAAMWVNGPVNVQWAMTYYFKAQDLRSWATTLNQKADELEEISWRFLMIAGERGQL